MRRAIKISAWTLGCMATVVVLLTGALIVAGNSQGGRALIERVTYRVTGGYVKLSGLGGVFPRNLTLEELELNDGEGTWLKAQRIALRWSPWSLWERRIAVEQLEAARVDIERWPVVEPSSGGGGAPWIPHIEIARFSIDVLQLGAALAGRPATLSVRGGGHLRSLDDAAADVLAQRAGGDGEYALHLRFDPASMEGTLDVHEPAGGPLENILELPGLGALSVHASIAGPRSAERMALVLDAGELHASADGSADLRQGSADLEYSLQSPELAPRPDLRWQHVALKGRWKGSLAAPTADGHLEIEGLELPGRVGLAALRAQLAASRGAIALDGVIDGLRIPGPAPALLARDRLQLEASLRTADPDRPLEVTATHPLFSVKARVLTAERPSMTLQARLPDVAPFAALVRQDVRGDATVNAQIEPRGAGLGFAFDASASLSAGSDKWIARLANRLALKLSGTLTDEALSVQRAEIQGPAWALSGSARATRPTAPAAARSAGGALEAYVKQLEAEWHLRVSDLSALAPQLGGELEASGRMGGPPSSLALDCKLRSRVAVQGSEPGAVSAELHAQGLPTAPEASLRAQGTLDGSPLELVVALAHTSHTERLLRVERADWKSAHAEGELRMISGAEDSRGEMRLKVGRIGDFDRILGSNVQGRLEGELAFTPEHGRTRAVFGLGLTDLAVGGFLGSLHLTGEGSTDSVDAKLDVDVPDLKGAPAKLSAGALVNLDAQELRVSSIVADYRGREARLLSPAIVSFRSGLGVERLRLGAEDAVFDVDGDVMPSLDLSASLEQVGPRLLNAFLSEVVSEGSIEGRAHLQGSLFAPTGSISLNARGIRFASEEAVGLPAVDLHAIADLRGDAASIDLHLTAGSASSISASGDVPLDAAGAYDLKIAGKMDASVANPLFEARGMHESGQITVDAALGGHLADPQISGTVALTKGSLRDYAHGLNLTNIAGEVFGSQGTLQIKSFKASAASGTVAMTGSIGALQPGIPIDLEVTAARAQAITNSLVTANVNADIHVSGAAEKQLAVTGSVHVNRATIGIPDSFPPNVAVLDVRRRGKPSPVAAKKLTIGLDVAIQSRQILVQGRGLDAELGGELHIGGTTDSPVVTGGFDLQRGTFTVANSRLTFSTDSRVSFDGSGLKRNIDPTLDFTAQTTVNNIEAKLRITGYADSPKFELTAAGQSPDEIMAMLLFGENPSQLTALQLAQVGAALATLTGVGGSGGNPLTKLQRSLGLDRLSLGQGTTTSPTGTPENTGAAIQAGRYISRRVYVEGKQTTTGQSQVEVDVDLTRHLKLQTRLGNGTAIQGTTPENDPGSSVGVQYQFEY